MFETLLTSFRDKIYELSLEQLKKEFYQKKQKVIVTRGMNAYRSMAYLLEFNFVFKKFELLIALATRKGFTVTPDFTDYVGVKKNAKL